MKLYQYTTIEALSLILKHKTIRFSRLDTVDDPDEYQYEKDGINPSKYVFVSCWSKVVEECIPMWRMYANNGRGVRIGLDSEMFEMKYSKGYPYFFDVQYFLDKDFFMTPLMRNQQPYYPLYDIQYVSETRSVLDKIFKMTNGGINLDFKELAKYKSKDWQFQREVRFIINLFPKQKFSDKVYNFRKAIPEGVSVDERHVDIPIKDSVFMSMEVVLGPEASEADESIVESLMFNYLGRRDCGMSKYRNNESSQ